MIKAINTYYDGHYFRSRLEARVAVFLNELKLLEHDGGILTYDYEPEGYLTSEGSYLPDFYVKNLPIGDAFGAAFGVIKKCFLEVKGVRPTKKEIQKAQALADQTDTIVGFVIGTNESNLNAKGDVWPCNEAGDHLQAFKRILLAERLDKAYGGSKSYTPDDEFPNIDFLLYMGLLGGTKLDKVTLNGPVGSSLVDFWVTPEKYGEHASVHIPKYASPDIYARPAKAALSARFEHGEKGVPAGVGFR